MGSKLRISAKNERNEMKAYKKPIDLTPCAPHLIAVHFADENYTATPAQQKLLCDEMWKRYNNHEKLIEILLFCVEQIENEDLDQNCLDNIAADKARAILVEMGHSQ